MPGRDREMRGTAPPAEVVHSLVEAFNTRDVDRFLELADDDIVVDFGDSRFRGRAALRDFFDRQLFGAVYKVEHRREFAAGAVVVGDARFELSFVDSGEVADVEEGAALYEVRHGRVTRYQEFPDVATALDAAGLTPADEVS